MRLSTQIKPISYLKNHASEIVKTISENHQPFLITQNGEAKLVIIDVQSYEEHEETLALLKILALGQQEIAEGKFSPADQVFKRIEKDDS